MIGSSRCLKAGVLYPLMRSKKKRSEKLVELGEVWAVNISLQISIRHEAEFFRPR